MPRIDQIWAYIALDAEPDDEGIPAMQVGDMLMPLIAADGRRLKEIRAMAQLIANATGKTMRLVKFSNREDLGEVRPATKEG